MIRGINASGRPVVAADVPSGLDADTGLVQGVAVRATVTVTFGLPKQGCFLHEGPAHTGALIVDSITIPPALLEAATA
jgi:NAD(P)H-hydrate epimerase